MARGRSGGSTGSQGGGRENPFGKAQNVPVKTPTGSVTKPASDSAAPVKLHTPQGGGPKMAGAVKQNVNPASAPKPGTPVKVNPNNQAYPGHGPGTTAGPSVSK